MIANIFIQIFLKNRTKGLSNSLYFDRLFLTLDQNYVILASILQTTASYGTTSKKPNKCFILEYL